ncbi:MAG: glutamine amidotransferase, partial [Planctomycetota bacterium]
LRRAVESDQQLQMTGLIRIARREAKFDFRGREGETSNSLFRGFDRADPDTVEEYDEPVLVRLNTQSAEELRGGFPQSAEELFRYDAVVVDDLEADFFKADQMKLLYDFVSRRGGGLLMMSGQESFAQGGFDRTPVGELLPIDLSRTAAFPQTGVRLELTRDGWLQPWVRIQSDEPAEQQRLERMPAFLTLNPPGYVRPGAQVMAEVRDAEGNVWPALIVQRFGRGRTAAVCIGDLWRWRLSEGLRHLQSSTNPSLTTPPPTTPAATPGVPSEDLSDHARACRQLMRWLVSDVPRRLEIGVKNLPEQGTGAVQLTASVRGADFEGRENADVRFKVTAPDGREFELTAIPADAETGVFHAEMAAAQDGAWRVTATAILAGGNSPETLTASSGWASQPLQQELQSVQVRQQWLEELATKTGGRVISLADVEELVRQLPTTAAPLQEVRSWPLWHSWWVFIAAVLLLSVDWTLRRRTGLP